jgi:transcription antitermination protein NusB
MREDNRGISVPLSVEERVTRVRARSWVLQILYAWESAESRPPLSDTMEEVFRSRKVAPGREPFIRRHVGLIERNLEEIDDVLRAAMDNWRLDRLSRVDRSILRLAVAEILHSGDVPPRVALQEGIRLAGQYGGDDSHRFVNGVLDAVYRSHHRQGGAASD